MSPPRDPPPASLSAATRVWAEASLGARVVTVTPLAGGLDAVTSGLEYDDGQRAVLRSLTHPERIRDYPMSVDTAVLAALDGDDLPVPTVLAVDETGLEAGSPAMLMTWLPGSHGGYLENPVGAGLQVCDAVRVIHGVTPPIDVPAYRLDRLSGEPLSGLAGEPLGVSAWSELRRLSPPPGRPLVLTHSDAWYGNLLWLDGRLTGIVDWSDTRLADAATDLAMIRLDVALLSGSEAADTLPAAEHQRFWDLWATTVYLAMCAEWQPAAATIGWPMSEPRLRAALRAHLDRLLAG